MKKQDVKIGMKVVPFRKSIGFLKNSFILKEAKKKGQPFLYVIGWKDQFNCWSLSEKKSGTSGDFFKSGDFKPYEVK